MPAPKGSNNCYPAQRKEMDFVIAQIDLHLEEFKNSKKHFKNLREICDALCEPISKSRYEKWMREGASGTAPDPLVRSTLYRGPEYRSKLDDFLENQNIKGSANNPYASVGEKIAQLQHELSNSKHELIVLRRYIQNIGTNQPSTNLKDASANEHKVDFAKTAQVVALLLEAAEGQFELQPDGGIRNLTKRVDNVIAPASLVLPFRKWLKSQENFSD